MNVNMGDLAHPLCHMVVCARGRYTLLPKPSLPVACRKPGPQIRIAEMSHLPTSCSTQESSLSISSKQFSKFDLIVDGAGEPTLIS